MTKLSRAKDEIAELERTVAHLTKTNHVLSTTIAELAEVEPTIVKVPVIPHATAEMLRDSLEPVRDLMGEILEEMSKVLLKEFDTPPQFHGGPGEKGSILDPSLTPGERAEKFPVPAIPVGTHGSYTSHDSVSRTDVVPRPIQPRCLPPSDADGVLRPPAAPRSPSQPHNSPEGLLTPSGSPEEPTEPPVTQRCGAITTDPVKLNRLGRPWEHECHLPPGHGGDHHCQDGVGHGVPEGEVPCDYWWPEAAS